MDGCGGSTLFPLHRCKTIHLVRHAQGIHNVEGDKNYKAYMSPEYFDAHLTQLGWQQVDNLRKHVHTCELLKKVDLVITSPLLSWFQGVHPCDKRRSISEYQYLFPAIDFSLIESDEDLLWKANIRETQQELAERGRNFLNWLWTRKEKEIAIVTHSGFLFHTLKEFGKDCNPLMRNEICKHFANCELRSLVIVDNSMIGSDSSATNYPGKIPPGPGISDVDEFVKKDEPKS